jgi:uncharacterized membrane protein
VITLDHVYLLMGGLLLGVAWGHARTPGRWRAALFWGGYGVLFVAGPQLGELGAGCLVLGMVGLATWGLEGRPRGHATAAPADVVPPSPPQAGAEAPLGNRLFVPVLVVPVLTYVGALWLPGVTVGGAPLVPARQGTQVALAGAAVAGVLAALVLLRPPRTAVLDESRRLLDAVGWAAVLPQALAALGAVFAAAGVGDAIAQLARVYLPVGTPLAAAATYAVGMALFTIVMGNAFAAFPVMTAGIGLPLLVRQFGGDVVVVSAVGMLSGYCGTLCTPMAANYNLVPAALLELPDRYGVIRAQLPTAVLLLVANIGLLWWGAFPHR